MVDVPDDPHMAFVVGGPCIIGVLLCPGLFSLVEEWAGLCLLRDEPWWIICALDVCGISSADDMACLFF